MTTPTPAPTSSPLILPPADVFNVLLAIFTEDHTIRNREAWRRMCVRLSISEDTRIQHAWVSIARSEVLGDMSATRDHLKPLIDLFKADPNLTTQKAWNDHRYGACDTEPQYDVVALARDMARVEVWKELGPDVKSPVVKKTGTSTRPLVDKNELQIRALMDIFLRDPRLSTEEASNALRKKLQMPAGSYVNQSWLAVAYATVRGHESHVKTQVDVLVDIFTQTPDLPRDDAWALMRQRCTAGAYVQKEPLRLAHDLARKGLTLLSVFREVKDASCAALRVPAPKASIEPAAPSPASTDVPIATTGLSVTPAPIGMDDLFIDPPTVLDLSGRMRGVNYALPLSAPSTPAAFPMALPETPVVAAPVDPETHIAPASAAWMSNRLIRAVNELQAIMKAESVLMLTVTSSDVCWKRTLVLVDENSAPWGSSS